MLLKRAFLPRPPRCEHYSTTTPNHVTSKIRPIPILPTSDLETFRTTAFNPALPFLLPRQTFLTLPAIQKWFLPVASSGVAPMKTATTALNTPYLSRFGSTIVPLEFTATDPETGTMNFTRTEQSLSFFLECVEASTSQYLPRPTRYFTAYVPGARASKKHQQRQSKGNDKDKDKDNNNNKTATSFFTATAPPPPLRQTRTRTGIYLAQAPLTDLPQALRDDVPTPSLVLQAGRGDVYSSSIWIGNAPTYTPLHRDPNPNLFVQVAGRKRVRLCAPDIGRGILARVREKVASGGHERLRGEEMMEGAERRVLEEEVWGVDGKEGREWWGSLWEAEVGVGDALFIPLGWWHSVRSVGEGMTGSVNWWFR